MRHSIVAIGVAVTFFGCVGAAAQNADVGSSATGPELFARAYQVLHHPRCSNCHPADKRPRWGGRGDVHGMNVQGGKDEPEGSGRPPGRYGRTGLECQTCHQEENGELPGSPPGAYDSRPGHPSGEHAWRLAPSKMGWGGLGSTELCRHFRDNIGEVTIHFVNAHGAAKDWIDPLVKWAWEPGPGRQPPPGDVDQFVKIMMAWVDIAQKDRRAACPND